MFSCRFLNYLTVISFEPTYQIESGIGFGAGSFCFWLAGLLLHIQMSIPQPDPHSLQTSRESNKSSVPSAGSDLPLSSADGKSLV